MNSLIVSIIRPVAIVLTIALAAGCDGRDAPEPPVAAATAGSANDTATATAECVNRDEGYSVRYPAAWHVNTGELMGECALFDPAPVEVPPDSEVPIEIAIMIDVEQVPVSTIADAPIGHREISREEVTVAGRDALRILAETTGEGLHDPGIRFYQYLVDLGEATLIGVTYEAGEPEFERRRSVLDDMMSTLSLDPGR